LEGGFAAPPAGQHTRFAMLTKIRERTQGAVLREELLCEEANFRTLTEAISGAIFITDLESSHVRHQYNKDNFHQGRHAVA
jgi:hypothetical protein